MSVNHRLPDPARPVAPGLDPRGLPPGRHFDPEWEVTPRETVAALRRPEPAILLDCRRPEEFAAATLPGALCIPMNEMQARLAELETAAGDSDRAIIVYCHTGRRSLSVAAFLRQQGFTDVKSMAGGIDLWSVDLDPSVPRY